tara:strand:- start:483 stop:1541 length:1059 start_codon:yes stop_codon:yes gene_type:complete
MKKTITILIALGVLIGLGWYVLKLNNNAGKSDTKLISFAIKNVDKVDKVIINDPMGNEFEIQKNNGVWTDKNNGCISQESVNFIIDALKNIEFRGYIAEAAIENTKKRMATQHIKVQIFENGDWTKTWFIGPNSQDHHGQIMLLESKEFGQSNSPVEMKIKGIHGFLSSRFFADSKKWMCTNVFALEVDEISKIDVKVNDQSERSFSVSKKATNIHVYQQNKELSLIDTAMVYRYLHNYKKIHFEMANYNLNVLQIDSLKKTIPFAEISIHKSNGEKTGIKCYRIKKKTVTLEGQIQYRDNNEDRFWGELDNGQIVKCQYYVFNPLLMGHIYFPMDISMLNQPTSTAFPDGE